jgi:DNA-directed RNA polymerase subunit RPC12/RpoP
MPRKARRRREPRDSVRSVQRAYRQREVIYQCLQCGARADPHYGVGDESWCPHCDRGGTVVGEEGKFPLPHLYEQWRLNQTRKAQQPREHDEVAMTLGHLAWPTPGQMHSVKTHTGTFYCPRCWIEAELFAQESLKCGRCGGLLKRGRLDDVSPPVR